MSPYKILEVVGTAPATEEIIHRMNGLAPEIFPPLTPDHLANGFWWLAYLDEEPVAFAGLVPFEPFPNVGYLKRAYVLPDHRGHGLQLRLMTTRELKARELGWSLLVSECRSSAAHSAANFCRAGFARVDPEQRWGAPNSIYWAKALT